MQKKNAVDASLRHMDSGSSDVYYVRVYASIKLNTWIHFQSIHKPLTRTRTYEAPDRPQITFFFGFFCFFLSIWIYKNKLSKNIKIYSFLSGAIHFIFTAMMDTFCFYPVQRKEKWKIMWKN